MIFSCGIDLDGCLFDSLTPTLNELNNRNGTNFKHSDITSYQANECLGITHNEFLDVLNHIWINNFREIIPYELDVDDSIKRLRNTGYQVLIVTRRDLKTILSVVNVLKKWRIIVDGFVCLNNNLSKTLVNVDFMIDDSKEVTNSFGKKGYLIKRSYNKNYDIESIKQFVDIILAKNEVKIKI